MAPKDTPTDTGGQDVRQRERAPHPPTYRDLIRRRSRLRNPAGAGAASRQFAGGAHAPPPGVAWPRDSAAGRARQRARISTRRHG